MWDGKVIKLTTGLASWGSRALVANQKQAPNLKAEKNAFAGKLT